MSKETKIGLLVGLVFIVLFGLVLSQVGQKRPDPAAGEPIADAGAGGGTSLNVAAPPGPNIPTPGGADAKRGSPAPGAGGTGGDFSGTPGGAPARPATRKPFPGKERMTVRQGDTVESILKAVYGPDFTGAECAEQVLKANSLANARALRAGIRLTMPTLAFAGTGGTARPGGDTTPGTGPALKGEPAPGGRTPAGEGRSYTIARGDTLETIARKQCGGLAAVESIKKLNSITDPRRLRVGQVIKLPDPATASTKAGSPSGG